MRAEDLLQQTLDRAAIFGKSFIELVHRAENIEGVGSVFERIRQRDNDSALDHLMEIKYGVLFKSLGFRCSFEPTGDKGPDLGVERDGLSAFVEVKRYRPKEGEVIPKELEPTGELKPYGNPLRTIDLIEKDLRCKLGQIAPKNGVDRGILAVWSDREYFEDVEFEGAVRSLREKLPEEVKRKVLFCIFGSEYRTVGTGRRFSCEPVYLPTTFRHWMTEIRDADGR